MSLNGFSRGGKAVLGPINLTVAPGETLALVGPSGIGKSSLLRVIAGLETTYAGTCETNGTVAMVFQEPTLLPWRSVVENIMIPTGVSRPAADQALADVGLQDRGEDYPLKLSLGQQRRLSLARAFAVKPALLLLDEPFVSLDPALVAEMMGLFKTLRAAHGVATILVTHVVEEAEALADRIITMSGNPAIIA